MAFEGEGHRLGGKEAPMKFGDPQSMSRYVTDTGLVIIRILLGYSRIL